MSDNPNTNTQQETRSSSRQKSSSVYVAHPVIHASYGKDFTKKARALGIDAINPLRGKVEYEIARLRQSGVEIPQETCERIARLDFSKIDKSDGLVALLFPGAGGTWMEIHHAWLKNKPVFVLYKLGGIVHPFIKVMSTKIFMHEKEMLDFLVKWNDWRMKNGKFPD